MTLIYATSSPGKLAELQRLASELAPFTITPGAARLNIHVEETGTSFEENALLKAEAYSRVSGLPALADDSGICIDALRGGPGIFSARFLPGETQDARNEQLSRMVGSRPPGERGAEFVCCLALVAAGETPLVVRASIRGEIAPEPRGRGGFGYDPIFLVPASGRTMGEMEGAEKDRVSHRGAAIALLLKRLATRTELADLIRRP